MELKIFPYVAGDGSGKRKVRASVPGKPSETEMEPSTAWASPLDQSSTLTLRCINLVLGTFLHILISLYHVTCQPSELDKGFRTIPGSGRSPGEGHGNLLQ